MCTTEDNGTILKGLIVLTDPVEQYLQGLDASETPKEIYVSKESHALKTIYPVINKYGQVESLLDSGSTNSINGFRSGQEISSLLGS